MTEKKGTKKATANTVDVIYKGKKQTFELGKPLPMENLEKDFGRNSYVEVKLVRAIAREMKCLKKVMFDDEKVVCKGTNKSKKPIVSLRQVCTVMTKDGEVYQGIGAMSVTESSILSDAVYGTFSRLRARALKDAMKYIDEIFELPTDEYVDVKEVKEDEVDKIVSDTGSSKSVPEQKVEEGPTDKDKEHFKNKDVLPMARKAMKDIKDPQQGHLTKIFREIRQQLNIPESGWKNEVFIECYTIIKEEFKF